MMPSDMRLQCPSEDTPPSTRPPSVASSSTSASGFPHHRSTSMDSLHTNSSTSEKPSGEEYIPTRLIRATPKANSNAMQFVKTGPANLHKSAKEQMKKAEVVKSLRKTSLQEEEEWQSNSSGILGPDAEGSDWQTNLDKWKCSRRKRNEDVLERVIEVKKNEQDTDFSKTRRKSKTFSEMREDKNKRGRRYNLVVHDDDNNDLSDLGLTSGKNGSSLSDPADDGEVKYADTKSDAGFCTGSDTGSDGVFAEDSISDTSSAMGDKREIHDSLLESGTTTSTTSKEVNEIVTNGHTTISVTKRATLSHEYTYDKAIEDYKTFAENSAKKRTSSITSLSSNASGSKEETEKPLSTPSPRGTSPVKKLDDKVFEAPKMVAEPKFLRRERNQPKVDIDKRRSMFELREIDNQVAKRVNKSTIDLSTSLRTKVASFENLNSDVRPKGVTPPRDTKFKEKLASFSQKEKDTGEFSGRKKTPERDQNFYQKLQNFSRLEESAKPTSEWRGSGSIPRKFPERTSSWKTSSSSHTRLSSNRSFDSRSTPAPTPLKDRIASFENLSPIDGSSKRRELSVSMENLDKRSSSFSSDGGRSPLLTSSQSVSNLFRRAPSTPFMVVEVEESLEEKPCVKRSVTRDYEIKSPVIGSESVTAESVNTKADTSLEPVGGTKISQVSEDSTLEPPSPNKQEVYSPSRRTEIHTPKVAPRTLPEVPKPRNKSLPRTPEVVASRGLPDTPTTYASRILPELPPQEPDVPPPIEPENANGTIEEPFNQAPEDAPPPVPPPRVPAIEVPYNASPAVSYLEKSSGLETSADEVLQESPSSAEDSRNEMNPPSPLEYGDHDIDEVIDNYEHLSEAITIGDGGAHPDNFQATEVQQQENFYEKIVDEEPLYENIYEKVSEEDDKGLGSEDGPQDHHYQTLDEVNTEKANLPSSAPPISAAPTVSPVLPLKNKNLPVYEVLDVTWTEDLTSSPALPPSVSPPPPPPEEDDEEEEEEEVELREGNKPYEVGALPHQHPNAQSSTVEDKGYNSFNGTQSTKQDLRKKMSDFLGTKPHVEEEVTLQPPPDVSELLRQEREAERLIVQKQASLARESPLLDFDFYGGSSVPGRTKYTWEDRMKADGPDDTKRDLDESTDTFEFHTKLAELEQEMVKHDRSMLQRVQGSPVKEEPLLLDTNVYTEQQQQQKQQQHQQEQQQQQFCTRKGPCETVLPFPEPMNSSINKQPAQTPPNVPPPNQSARLPIQAFYTAPLYTEVESGNHSPRYTTSQEKIYNSEPTTCSQAKRRDVEEPLPPKSLPQAPPPIPRKQSILALSAIPKPRLTDNDSWIMKRKAEAGKKDYSKHWLIQEAEQRRLEQQERISRPVQLPLGKPASELLGTSPNHNHFQNFKSYHPSTTQHTNHQLSFPLSNGPPALSPLSPNKPIPNTNGMLPPLNEPPNKHIMNGPPNVSSTSSNNLWKKQTKTYQPPQPSPPTGTSKPLPDAIINSLTQRVNNKNKLSGSSRPTVYSSGNYRTEDNYHDYMNTDTFNPSLNSSSSSSNNNNSNNLVGSPIAQSSPGLNHLPPGDQSTQLSEDQRLLSVSGKKKCSQCGEELGRGAAMVIESLRLFYHIPCFKCCVCGTQLGNGLSGADVRVRNHKLHCHNCYSNDEGMKFSKV